jgi:hypothetical protein
MMPSTIFPLFMSGWMLALVLQYGMTSLPVITLLTAMIVSIRLIQHSIKRRQALLHFPANILAS